MLEWNITAGPRQYKPIREKMGNLRRMIHSFVEWTGVKMPDGTTKGEYRSVLTTLFGAQAESPRVLEVIDEALAPFVVDGKIQCTRANHADILLALHEAEKKAAQVLRVDDKRTTLEEDDARKAENEKRDAERAERAALAEDARKAILAKRPRKAEALIVAEYRVDKSDPTTDYFNSVTERYVAIGWRTGKREDFRRLRAAAARFPRTAHLGTGCDVFTVQACEKDGTYIPSADIHGEKFATRAEAEAAIAAMVDGWPGAEYHIRENSVEHRENYSMGAGNYLSAGGRHGTGWVVRSYNVNCLPSGIIEDALDECAKVTPAAADGGKTFVSDGQYDAGSVRIVKRFHTKKKFDYWQVELEDRVERDEFERLRDACKAAGGWYSRKWGKVPGGYAFDNENDARDWVVGEFHGQTEESKAEENPEPAPVTDPIQILKDQDNLVIGTVGRKPEPEPQPDPDEESSVQPIEDQPMCDNERKVLRALTETPEDGPVIAHKVSMKYACVLGYLARLDKRGLSSKHCDTHVLTVAGKKLIDLENGETVVTNYKELRKLTPWLTDGASARLSSVKNPDGTGLLDCVIARCTETSFAQEAEKAKAESVLTWDTFSVEFTEAWSGNVVHEDSGWLADRSTMVLKSAIKEHRRILKRWDKKDKRFSREAPVSVKDVSRIADSARSGDQDAAVVCEHIIPYGDGSVVMVKDGGRKAVFNAAKLGLLREVVQPKVIMLSKDGRRLTAWREGKMVGVLMALDMREAPEVVDRLIELHDKHLGEMEKKAISNVIPMRPDAPEHVGATAESDKPAGSATALRRTKKFLKRLKI